MGVPLCVSVSFFLGTCQDPIARNLIPFVQFYLIVSHREFSTVLGGVGMMRFCI